MVAIPAAAASWTLLPVEPAALLEELLPSCQQLLQAWGEQTLPVELPVPVGGSWPGLLLLSLVTSGSEPRLSCKTQFCMIANVLPLFFSPHFFLGKKETLFWRDKYLMFVPWPVPSES